MARGNRVVLIRHAETAWSRSGQHTSFTDIPMTEAGREVARGLAPVLADWDFSLVLTSPLQRARETADLAGFGAIAELDAGLTEWNYGAYEGITTAEIRETVPGWTVFTHPCPGGETAEEVSARVDLVLERARAADGDVALFAHGHIGRVIVSRWNGLAATEGKHFVLSTGRLTVLGWERESPAILRLNAPS
ncbi:MAG: histidine phosphatase family protein [Deltaproteobacteria bacterium]